VLAMPIVEGRYEAKISTTFKTVEDGISEIKKKIERARRIRINNIPMNLLEDLKPLLAGKDLKIILPIGEKPGEDLKRLGEVATTKARIYIDHMGEEADSGSICLSTVTFNIIWKENRILEISTMEYSKCVKCMLQTFEKAWKYSKKW